MDLTYFNLQKWIILWLYTSLVSETSFAFLLDESNFDLYRCPSTVSRDKYLITFRETCLEFVIYNEEYWQEARDDCRSKGGDLVIIPDADTQMFITLTLDNFGTDKAGIWIGLTDKKDELDWTWVNGERVDYSHWAGNEGGANGLHYTQDCAQLRRDDHWLWNDRECFLWPNKYSYICEYAMSSTSTTPSAATTPMSSSTEAAITPFAMSTATSNVTTINAANMSRPTSWASSEVVPTTAVAATKTTVAPVTSQPSQMYRCPGTVPRDKYLVTFREKCLEFVLHNEEYWQEARDDCRSKGGDLVVIPDSEKQMFLILTLQELNNNKDGIWIGLTDKEKELKWKWVDGKPLEYSYWAADQNNGLHYTQDCAQIRADDHWFWHDRECFLWPNEFSYICEYDMYPATTPSTSPQSPTNVPTTSSANLPTTSSANVPTTSSEATTTSSANVPATSSANVTTTSSANFPTTSPEATTTSSANVPATSSANVTTTSSANLPTTSSANVTTTSSANFPTTSPEATTTSMSKPITYSLAYSTTIIASSNSITTVALIPEKPSTQPFTPIPSAQTSTSKQTMSPSSSSSTPPTLSSSSTTTTISSSSSTTSSRTSVATPITSFSIPETSATHVATTLQPASVSLISILIQGASSSVSSSISSSTSDPSMETSTAATISGSAPLSMQRTTTTLGPISTASLSETTTLPTTSSKQSKQTSVVTVVKSTTSEENQPTSPTTSEQMVPSPTTTKQMVPSPTTTKQMVPSPTTTKQMVPSPTTSKHMVSETTSSLAITFKSTTPDSKPVSPILSTKSPTISESIAPSSLPASSILTSSNATSSSSTSRPKSTIPEQASTRSTLKVSTSTPKAQPKTSTAVVCSEINCPSECPNGYTGVYVDVSGCITCNCN